ncbi:MAG: HAMP domain-containing histidine kinase [Chloroflexi bacterium]|nr:HAMP domain-containing histidine kinase [Chloroflexota bacterium]MBP8055775.1 HAMP domain-containing histidine kinase [Chloroflexota bacterium]
MFYSVRRRLLLNSLLVSLVAIAAAGLVTYGLFWRYFVRGEQQYLQTQANQMLNPLTDTLIRGDLRAVENIIRDRAFMARLRARLFDENNNLLVDSGRFDSERLPLVQGGAAAQPLPPNAALPGSTVNTPFIPPISDEVMRFPLYQQNEVIGWLELSEGPAVGEPVLRDTRYLLLASSVAALLLAGFVGLWSARQVTNPLAELGAAADRMAQGDLSSRAPDSSLREFQQLAGQFNSMAGRLEQTVAALEADRVVLRRLIADASHELRTPLTALKTFNELLQQDGAAAIEPSATFIRESARQLVHLDHLTTNLLDLSRLEARLSGTNFELANVCPAIEMAVWALRPLAEARQHTLSLDLPVEPVLLKHDAAALQRALANLISNAIKFSGNQGHIQVRLEQNEARVRIQVQDNGPGIPATDQGRVFERFYRGREQKEAGTGLGLAICREIVTIHGGELTLVSQVGVGSTFTIELPFLARNNA